MGAEKCYIRPKLRPGFVLNLFTTHCFKTLIDKRLSMVCRRTRSNRKCSFGQLWTFLLIGKYYAHSFRLFIADYPLIMGRVSCEQDAFLVERLFGQRCRFSSHVFQVLITRGRLPLFAELNAFGNENIMKSIQVPALKFKLECPQFNDSFVTFCNRYVKSLNLCISTLSIEWAFNILYSLSLAFPALNSIQITYYHLILPTKTHLLSNFVEKYENVEGFSQFLSLLKNDEITIEVFIQHFIELISSRFGRVQFMLDIVWPLEGSTLVSSNSRVQNVYVDGNLRVDLLKIGPSFDLMKK